MRLFEVANKGIPRSQMPQIHVEDIKDDYNYRQGKLSLKKMKPVQTERVESEYKKAVQKIKSKQAKPILLDKNLRIVNGHHRYDAYRHLGFDSVPAVIVDATLEDLMSKYQHTSEEAGAGGAGAGGGAAGGTGGATGSTGGATSSSGDSGSADSGDAGDSGSDSAEATPPPSRGFLYVGSVAPYKSSKKKKKKKKKTSGFEFGKGVYESAQPNFDFEWDEAQRYPEFEKIGKDAWIKLAQTGKLVKINSASDINNTDAGAPESFYNLDKNKQKRALQQVARGEVEPPIVARYSDGHKELLAGNTRLTAMMLRKGSATVWQFDVPDEVAELAEGTRCWKGYTKKGMKTMFGKRVPNCVKNENLNYYGNCTQDDVVDYIFGDVSEFARQVELHGDEFEMGDVVVKYDAEEDIHHFYIDENFLAESFNQPYPVKVIQSPDSEDYEAALRLPDGTGMEILFTEQGGIWDMEFHRGGSQDVTGEGDAFRIFATMMEAVRQFIRMEKPGAVSFTATKDVPEGQDPESRAKLYTRMVERFADSLGYDAYIDDYGDMVEYELVNKKHVSKGVDENFADGKVKGKSRPGRVKKAGASCKGSVSSLRAKAKKYSGERSKMYHWCANMKSGRKK